MLFAIFFGTHSTWFIPTIDFAACYFLFFSHVSRRFQNKAQKIRHPEQASWSHEKSSKSEPNNNVLELMMMMIAGESICGQFELLLLFKWNRLSIIDAQSRFPWLTTWTFQQFFCSQKRSEEFNNISPTFPYIHTQQHRRDDWEDHWAAAERAWNVIWQRWRSTNIKFLAYSLHRCTYVLYMCAVLRKIIIIVYNIWQNWFARTQHRPAVGCWLRSVNYSLEWFAVSELLLPSSRQWEGAWGEVQLGFYRLWQRKEKKLVFLWYECG